MMRPVGRNRWIGHAQPGVIVLESVNVVAEKIGGGGRVPLEQVCDAHPELIRAAANVGTQTSSTFPICEQTELRLVTYVFGPRIGPQGRCVSTAKEMRELNSRTDELNAYVVEACTECRWHHLLRVLPIGGRR